MTALMDTESRQRATLCELGRDLFLRGYAHGSAGNLSARLADGRVIITPTDACLGRLDPDRLALIGRDGLQQSGDRASKTLALHRAIYAADAGIGAIVHTHSPQLVALTLERVWRAEAVLPPLTAYQVMKVGAVPLLPWQVPGDDGVAAAIVRQIEDARREGRRLLAVLLERLGPIAWQQDPESACHVLEELEETARLWRQCRPRPAPLTAAQVRALELRFLQGVHGRAGFGR
jgi:ribulose-5-phosphate 4-epimerase/fuculose-1-phosphate aldolase